MVKHNSCLFSTFLQVTILSHCAFAFLTPCRETLFQPRNEFSSFRGSGTCNFRFEKPSFSLIRSQVSANDAERQILMKTSMPAILQSVGLFPSGSTDVMDTVVFENAQSSLRIESWGGDVSYKRNVSDDRTVLLWLPGLDGTSLTGKSRSP